MSEMMQKFNLKTAPVVEENEAFVWDCPDCGKMMLKTAPVCARCGYVRGFMGRVATRPFGKRRVCALCGTLVINGSNECWYCKREFMQ